MSLENRKFLLDEFKRMVSAAGFRGYVTEVPLGYRLELEPGEFTYRQLVKLSELAGTRSINVRWERSGFQGSELTPPDSDELFLEVIWP